MIAAMKVLILLAALLFLFPFPILRASAEEAGKTPAAEVYAVAARNDVWLYTEENEESGLFLLPYTYYVRVLERGEEFSAVVYGEDAAPYRTVEGYCKTEMLTFVDFIPERPFLKLEVTVTYTVPGPSEMGNGTFDEIERTFHYYGTSYLGTQRYFYVLSDGVFDYIPAARDVNYELNTDYLEETVAPAPDDPSPEAEPAGLTGWQIAALTLGILAVAAIAFFVLRGKRSPVPSEGEEF